MATYQEKKREAAGLSEPQPQVLSNSDFDVPPAPRGMQTSSHVQFWEKKVEGQADEQRNYISALQFFDEYDNDQKAAKKNCAELIDYLLTGKADRTAKLLAKRPAAEWLNRIFLDDTEIDSLTSAISAAQADCRKAVNTALKTELDRMFRFKTLFDHILAL
ncbi:MAG: hypothetical protein LBR50_07445 [Tannerella sp.]|jgi:hypothetical protein|nr:hypothetical protein [Tannerella sp.]